MNKKTKTTNDAMFNIQCQLEMTNKELAQALDVSRWTVGAWRRNPKSSAYRIAPYNLVRLAGFLLAAKKTRKRGNGETDIINTNIKTQGTTEHLIAALQEYIETQESASYEIQNDRWEHYGENSPEEEAIQDTYLLISRFLREYASVVMI